MIVYNELDSMMCVNFNIISTTIKANYKFSKTYLFLNNNNKRLNDLNNSLCHKNG